MSKNNTTFVNILDKEYQVACPPEEKRALDKAAVELDQRMRTIRSSGSVIGAERIAVMAALNLCYELQNLKNNANENAVHQELQRINEKLQQALDDQ